MGFLPLSNSPSPNTYYCIFFFRAPSPPPSYYCILTVLASRRFNWFLVLYVGEGILKFLSLYLLKSAYLPSYACKPSIFPWIKGWRKLLYVILRGGVPHQWCSGMTFSDAQGIICGRRDFRTTVATIKYRAIRPKNTGLNETFVFSCSWIFSHFNLSSFPISQPESRYWFCICNSFG